jgi:hypothetical protein
MPLNHEHLYRNLVLLFSKREIMNQFDDGEVICNSALSLTILKRKYSYLFVIIVVTQVLMG